VSLIGGIITGALIPQIFAAMTPLIVGLIGGYLAKLALDKIKGSTENFKKNQEMLSNILIPQGDKNDRAALSEQLKEKVG
jgi:hypothetical protein